MKCEKCGSLKTIQTKEGKLYCRTCGHVSMVRKRNFISRMRTKLFGGKN